jgi:hypothetical protein
MAAPVFGAAGAGAGAGTSATYAVAYPAGLTRGDLLLLHVWRRGTGGSVTLPDGWNQIATQSVGGNQHWILARIASGEETGTVNATATAGVLRLNRMYRFSGARGATTADFEGTASTSGSATNHNMPSVTTTGPDRLVVAFHGIDDDNRTPASPTGETGGDWTEGVAEYQSANNSGGTIAFHTATMASAGTISGGSSATTGGAEAYGIIAFAILPEEGVQEYFNLNAVIVNGVRVTQEMLDVLHVGVPVVRATQEMVEVLWDPDAPPNVRVTTENLQVLWKVYPTLKSFGMAARLKGASHKGGSKDFGTTSVTLNTPAATEEGDILVASISDNGGTAASVTPPAGWSLVGTRQTSTTVLGVSIYRYIVPPNVNPNHTFNVTGAANVAGVIDAYHNVLDVQAVGSQVNASSTSIVAPSISPASPNSMLVFVGTVAANTTVTPPSGMTEDANTEQATTGVTTEIAHSTPTASGATGTRTATAGSAGVNIGTLLSLPVATTEFWDFGLDAVIFDTLESDFGLDAVIHQEQGESFGLDAVIFNPNAGFEGEFGLDAVLRVEQGATFSLDAVIQRTYDTGFGVNAIVRDSRMGGFDLGAILLSPQTGSFGLDAHLLNVVTGSFGADAIVFKTIEATFGLNAIQKATIEGSFGLDAIKRVTQTGDFGLDAWKLKVVEASLGANAIVFKTQTADFGLNAVITRGIPFFVRFGNVMAAVVGFTNEYEFTSATSTAEQIAATSSASGYIAGTSSAEEITASTTYLIERNFGLDAWIEV